VSIGGGSSLNNLLIEDLGTVLAGGMTVGNPGVSVSNTLVLNNARLVVTNTARTATLAVNEGALFLTSADLLVDRLQTSPLSLLAFGSGMANVRTLSLAANSAMQIGDGLSAAQLQLGATTHVIGNLTVAPSAALILAGTANGTITNRGLLEIGTNVTGPTLTGNLVQTSSGSMAFDLGGTVQRTGYDFLQLDGTAQFDGLLRLRLVNGFVPASNNNFTLMNARGINGSFANAPSGSRITLEGTAVTCRVEYSAGTLRLSHFQNAGPATNEIDEAWAMRYFGHSPLTEAEKQADNDGDGLRNYEEYLAGTDPWDGQSALRILAVQRTLQGHTAIQFTSETNRTYGIAFSADFDQWQDLLAPVFDVVAPGRLQWIDDGSQTGGLGGRRFYRVLVR